MRQQCSSKNSTQADRLSMTSQFGATFPNWYFRAPSIENVRNGDLELIEGSDDLGAACIQNGFLDPNALLQLCEEDANVKSIDCSQ